MSHFQKLAEQGIITNAPGFVYGSIQYETIMGSESYGVASGGSDIDVYGFCIPPKEYIFPHIKGYILGFGKKPLVFQQYEQHHIWNKEKTKQYDFSIYSIIKYFQLCMENNPNMIDSLFTSTNCVLQCTKIGNMVRDQRKDFLHKGSWHKFKGYSYSMVHKMKNKFVKRFVELCKELNIPLTITRDEYCRMMGNNIHPEFMKCLVEIEKDGIKSKRLELVDKFGFDVKFAYHLVRLLNEVEQIIDEGDLDLQRNKEQLKSIRNGEWSLQQIEEYFTFKERELEKLYQESKLQYSFKLFRRILW